MATVKAKKKAAAKKPVVKKMQSFPLAAIPDSLKPKSRTQVARRAPPPMVFPATTNTKTMRVAVALALVQTVRELISD